MKQAAPNQQMQAVLDELAALGGKPISTLTATEARKQPTPAAAVKALLFKRGDTQLTSVVTTVDRQVAGAAGELPARIFTPTAPTGSAPFPVLLYFHGGGFVIADKNVYDAGPRALAEAANCVVVSVDYREGPEHRFPAAHDDAAAAYRWLLENAHSLQGDPQRIAVGGESAGGNLAANVSIAARDQGLRIPVHQLLVYPMASSDMNTPSYIENATAKPLNKEMMVWFGEMYFQNPTDGKDPRIDLVSAKLKRLPSTTIITAQIDPLRSGGEKLAALLKSAGVDVALHNYQGVTHEFFGMGAAVDEARQAVAFSAARLKRDFAR